MGLSASKQPPAKLSIWLKVLLIALVVVLNGYAIIAMYANGEFAFALLTLVIVASGVYVFTSKKTYAHRYIFPGIAGMVVFIIFPLVYTIGISFTNYSATNLLTFNQVLQQFESKTYTDDSGAFKFGLYQRGEDFEIIVEQGELLYSTGPIELDSQSAVSIAHELSVLNAKPSEKPLAIKAVIQNKDALDKLILVTPNEQELVRKGLREFAGIKPLFTPLLQDGQSSYSLPNGETITSEFAKLNVKDGRILIPNMETGYFQYLDDQGELTGRGLKPGFTVGVGWEHFKRVLTDEGIKQPFVQIFVWTVIFATCAVVFTLAIGMLLACLVQWEELKGRAIYRVLLILPYAVPAFISILVFKGLFNQNFGEINMILGNLFGISPAWFTDPVLAKSMILIVNTWLGYPYMMILCMGMLKSIPDDLYEASAMDGAGPITNFFNITVPLLMKPLAPLLIASFAFNFNNFVLIDLLTGGLPDIIGASTPAGETDLLVSYTYRIAFQGDGGNNYGLASAIATLIFLVVGALALLNLRIMKKNAN
ncbi:maltose ABC transporter permease MalF [Alginatibacterium sediminis]|uniref:Maltose/maltodextrin transport system permease protein n=1 Tax=Alginatibacterium sediminis TaxID=2164068 RepID=A0A420EFS1_9ALTE|nr:maltose ABC transporter permease MalF [Alginatibacterium sediminis]RKF19552.1 maltose ABC transporter permease MalF [Alginatibacterium sediminis]